MTQLHHSNTHQSPLSASRLNRIDYKRNATASPRIYFLFLFIRNFQHYSGEKVYVQRCIIVIYYKHKITLLVIKSDSFIIANKKTLIFWNKRKLVLDDIMEFYLAYSLGGAAFTRT